jgi:Flp pilus assembly protein TadG
MRMDPSRRPAANRMPCLRTCERGSEMIEFGIVSMLFFFLLFGIVEFGRAHWTYDTLAHAAREGARFAMVHGSESRHPATLSQVEDMVRTRATGLTGLTVAATWDPDNDPGSVVQVRVDLPFNPLVPFLPTMTLTTTSRMTIAF